MNNPKLKANKGLKKSIYKMSNKNILPFRNTHPSALVSDQELISLFMGIIRLIREDEREAVLRKLCNNFKK